MERKSFKGFGALVSQAFIPKLEISGVTAL